MRKTRVQAIVLGVLSLLFALRGGAQTASLVADINPSQDQSSGGSLLSQFKVAGGKLFFIGGSYKDGGIWVTDGTGAGTVLLSLSCPDRPEDCSLPPQILASVKDRVLFWFTSEYGKTPKIWSSDGTRQGTFPLTVNGEPLFLPLNRLSITMDIATTADAVYFPACTTSLGCAAWKSDGSLEGTRLVVDTSRDAPGPAPRLFTAVGSRVFFVVTEGNEEALWMIQETGAATRLRSLGATVVQALTAGGDKLFFRRSFTEVWVSDGTAAGTRLLRSFRLPLFPNDWIKPLGGKVYFLGDDGTHGTEIWESNGTPEGTRPVTSFSEPNYDAESPFVEEVGGRLLLPAYNGGSFKLWAVPLGLTSAAPVDLCGSRCSLRSDFKGLARVGDKVLFVAEDSLHGQGVWSTDGTPAGTRILQACNGSCGIPGSFHSVPGAAFFSASGRVWLTDGTPEGTRSYTEGSFAAIAEVPGAFTAIGDRIFFAAVDALASPSLYGAELWTSDGRPGGTRLVADLDKGADGSSPSLLTALGDSVLFLACQDEIFGGEEVWRGSPGSAEVLTTGSSALCHSTNQIQQLVRAGQFAFWWGARDLSRNLWATDGTPAGTRRLTTYSQRFRDFEIPLRPFQNKIYFVKVVDDGPNEIWSSDGTVAGTGKTFDFPDSAGDPVGVIPAEGVLYILTIHPSQGSQIWVTDGTQASLQKIFSKNVSFFTSREGTLGSSLVSFIASSTNGYDLWKIDSSGSVRIKEFAVRSRNIVEQQGVLYFFNQKFTTDFGLWRSDGTAEGTFLVRKFPIDGFADLLETRLTRYGDRLFFVIDDRVHGPELWISDGTAEGTALVKDIYPGPISSQPSFLTVADGKLFFSANDGVHGTELWQSDGTAVGTRLVQDLAPGARSSDPTAMVVAGDRLYFAADDGLSGDELWSLPLSGPAVCAPSATSLCLNGGRFRVEAQWRTLDGHTGHGQAVALTADTGYFWFFDPANVETVVKVLDGNGLNGHFWVFYGALSNVEYTLIVTDTQTGLTRHYFNPQGQFGSVGDTTGFGPLGAYSVVTSAATAAQPRIASATVTAAGNCQPGATRLCLNGNRFAVEVTWKDFSGNMGQGHAVGLTGDTGYFWFFGDTNVELILKVLDGQAVNGKFWVFYGALSNVEYTIQVTDTATGKVKTYTNPGGQFASTGDIGAF